MRSKILKALILISAASFVLAKHSEKEKNDVPDPDVSFFALNGRPTINCKRLVIILYFQEYEDKDSHDHSPGESPSDSHGGEEEEPPEKVLAKWDGINIALCIFGIMTALIAITVSSFFL
jgi:hypothetical protein